jgi:hypothetical protein
VNVDQEAGGAVDAIEEGAPQLKYLIGLELSDPEVHSIGRIVSYWGFLEHELFFQAAMSFSDTEQLPKELLKNRDFPSIIKIWKERVVSAVSGERRTALDRQSARIEHLHQFRPAIVHAMWDWDVADPSVIISQRMVNKKVLVTRFSAKDLREMADALGEILYWVKYPGGDEDQAAEMFSNGVSGYMSRHWVAMMRGDLNSDVYLPHGIREALKAAGKPK